MAHKRHPHQISAAGSAWSENAKEIPTEVFRTHIGIPRRIACRPGPPCDSASIVWARNGYRPNFTTSRIASPRRVRFACKLVCAFYGAQTPPSPIFSSGLALERKCQRDSNRGLSDPYRRIACRPGPPCDSESIVWAETAIDPAPKSVSSKVAPTIRVRVGSELQRAGLAPVTAHQEPAVFRRCSSVQDERVRRA